MSPGQCPLRAAITAVATYVPERILTNAELATRLDTSDEWIVTRTGIRERRLGAPGETTSKMGAEAVRRLMDETGAGSRRHRRDSRRDRHPGHALPRHGLPHPGSARPPRARGASISRLHVPASSTR